MSEEHQTETADGASVAAKDEYTWADYLAEFEDGDEVDALYRRIRSSGGGLLSRRGPDSTSTTPRADDWNRINFEPASVLGFHPDDIDERLRRAVGDARRDLDAYRRWLDETPVAKDEYTWEHYKWEYYYDDGVPPRDDGAVVAFDRAEHLGLNPGYTENFLSGGQTLAADLRELEDVRTVNVNDDLDEDAFFSTADGHTTITNRYDLEKAVPFEEKLYFREIERYWVNKPYAFVVIFHSTKENETKYYVVEPHLTEIETDLKEYLAEKLRVAIKHADNRTAVEDEPAERARLIRDVAYDLLDRYDLHRAADRDGSLVARFKRLLGLLDADDDDDDGIEGIAVRPEPVLLEEDSDDLTEYQVRKILYYLERDFIGYERIDPIKHDVGVEDVSCDGYHSPVFVYHTDYEQLITNVSHGADELDDFVVKLAQRSGKGISKREPQVDATLPDGSRAQLTLGREVSDHGTNYTIRQFKDVPFTPVDLISWNTFSLEQMTDLWLAIENNKSVIFAGGTASGKTTSLNAVSLFIPSNTKIVSIEDTREVELPQRNWIASVTRPSFTHDDQGSVDEFDLLEAALRQRPDYIVMGEIRGEEGRTLFQVMSTGHTTLTTFHADSVGEVIKRFTTDPINVSKTMFTALDLVSIQTQTRVQGRKVRRAKTLTEINDYHAENDEINVNDIYEWSARADAFDRVGDTDTFEDIMFDRGWTREELDDELLKRRVVIAYLIENRLNEYSQVAATIQAFMNDPEAILTLIARDDLDRSLRDLRGMESVHIDVDPELENLVPRPDPGEDVLAEAKSILDEAERSLLARYRDRDVDGLLGALDTVQDVEDVIATPSADRSLPQIGPRESAPLADGGAAGSDGPDDAGDDRWATAESRPPDGVDGEDGDRP